MAKQYQEQNQNEYSDLDFEEVEEETQSKKYHFSVKGYIKKVCITGVILGLTGYAGSAIINGFDDGFDTDEGISIDEIQQGDGILDDTLSNEVSINGEYYSMPCQLSEILDNGWEISEYSETKSKDKIKGDTTKYISLENDKNLNMFVAVFSPTTKKISVRDAYVEYMSVYPDDELYVDIKVSGGLYTGMTCQEVDQLINENDWKHHKSTTESNWYYSIEYDNEDSPYVVSYSLDTKKKENQRIVTDITVNLYDNYDYD